MPKKKDLPYLEFYPGDWRKCPEVQALTLPVRQCWFEMLLIMSECRPRGYLSINGRKIPDEVLASMLGIPFDQPYQGLTQGLRGALSEMEGYNVFSRTEDGTIFSRRMVADEEKRVKFAEFGRKGGNPKLRDNGEVKAGVNPPLNHEGYPSPEDEDEDINPEGGKGETKAVPEKYSQEIREVVQYLNELCGTSFRDSTAQTRKSISGRLADGFTVADAKAVIKNRHTKWTGTDQAEYLRPDTLFRPANFEKYLQDAQRCNGVHVAKAPTAKVLNGLFERPADE